MNILESIILDVIYLTFPLLIYLFYIAYNKNLNKEKNTLIFELSLLTSFYLVYRFGVEAPLVLINIPLIIAYLKKKDLMVLILSFILIANYITIYSFNPVILILEYILYFILNITIKNKTIFMNTIIILKNIFYFYFNHITNISSIVISIITTWLVLNIVIYLLEKGEEIIKYHMSVKKLEEEKQLRISLFKITHEIKNPLAVIKGYLDMFDINNQQHTKKYIPIIKEEVEKTLMLLNDFLSITKIKINKDIMDINLLLEEICSTMIPLLKDKKINYKINITDDEIYINGDYNRLMQVFINIIKNSIEAIDKNGQIDIELINNPKNIVIIIKDNGSGIEKENLEKIKEPFFTTKKNGTGLGVSLSYEIIKQHQGSINYYSKEKEGTKVVIDLPKLLISF